MFDSLSEKLDGALKSLSGQGKINELNIAEEYARNSACFAGC